MEKARRRLRTQKGAKLYLSSRGMEDILPSNHQINIFDEVVDDNREIISPVFVPVLDQQIAALAKGILLLRAEQEIRKGFALVRQLHAQADIPSISQTCVAAMIIIAKLIAALRRPFEDFFPAATTGINTRSERFPRGRIAFGMGALSIATTIARIGLKTEPVEVIINAIRIVQAGALLIMILETEDHLGFDSPGDAPDKDGRGNMAQMQITRRTWSETCSQALRKICQLGTQKLHVDLRKGPIFLTLPLSVHPFCV